MDGGRFDRALQHSEAVSQVWGGGASVIVGGVKPDGEVRRCEQSLLWGRWHLGLCRVEQKEGQ